MVSTYTSSKISQCFIKIPQVIPISKISKALSLNLYIHLIFFHLLSSTLLLLCNSFLQFFKLPLYLLLCEFVFVHLPLYLPLRRSAFAYLPLYLPLHVCYYICPCAFAIIFTLAQIHFCAFTNVFALCKLFCTIVTQLSCNLFEFNLHCKIVAQLSYNSSWC